MKKRYISRIILLLSLVTLLVRCVKEEPKPDPPDQTHASNVYVLGDEIDLNHKQAVKLWKNGEGTNITDFTLNWNKDAISVFVSNSDVYLLYHEFGIYKLWKNGVITVISNEEFNYATSMYVSGNDVYISGFKYASNGPAYARLWKNGTLIDLSDGVLSSEANSVFVSGSDVYVAGNVHDTLSFSTARLWKNGIGTNLYGQEDMSNAFSVFVKDNDVYVAGVDIYVGLGGNYPTIWKNGVASHLHEKNERAIAHSVYVSDSDVYVVGHVGHFAKLWKNGIETNLSDGTELADARSVFVSGQDVYVAGDIFLNGVLWKNGVATNISNDSIISSVAYSVFVAPNQ